MAEMHVGHDVGPEPAPKQQAEINDGHRQHGQAGPTKQQATGEQGDVDQHEVSSAASASNIGMRSGQDDPTEQQDEPN